MEAWRSDSDEAPGRLAEGKRMENSPVTKKKTYAEWVEGVLKQSSAMFESAHLDDLEGADCADLAGPELVRHCRALLEEGRTILRKAGEARSFRYLIVFLPLRPADTLSLWEDELWDQVSGADEPPTAYLIARDPLLEEWDEEYRRPLQIPQNEDSAGRAMYRCWRTKQDMQNSWEFARGVYLVVEP
jgi:hypothetical protein